MQGWISLQKVRYFALQLFFFTWHEALSCIFPVILFAALAVTKSLNMPHRYDIMLGIAILTQVIMYGSGLETLDEVKVICIFHILGISLELYKVHIGSWAYPQAAWSKVGGVPLYSGFMYASIASYMCQAWRRLDMRLALWPRSIWAWLIGALIYINFFTDHVFYDLRWLLMLLLLLIFGRTQIVFVIRRATYRIPLLLGFALVGLFVWFAENFATYFQAWEYPNQHYGWHMVSTGKISSWALLVIVSGIIVAQLKHIKEERTHLTDH
jgi:uncharacterized membrane protein YoaT (DUF817 family)